MLDNLLAFGRLLRREGIEVHPGRMLDVVEALAHVNLAARDEVYHACRALLVHRHEQLSIFDRVFTAFWGRHPQLESQSETTPSEETRTAAAAIDVVSTVDALMTGHEGSDTGDETAEQAVKVWSDSGGLADKDFAALTPDEMNDVRQALSRLVWSPGERRTRRWVRGRGARIDLRRAIADSLRSGGDLVALPTRRRRVRPRPVVLLCDVSGSMERYSRM